MEARRALEQVLEVGERVSWSGRPEAGQLVGRRILRVVVSLGLALGIGYFMLRAYLTNLGVDAAEIRTLLSGWTGDPQLLVPAVVLAATPLFIILGIANEDARLKRTVYAVTDRRLLAAVGPDGDLLWSLPPEKVGLVRVRGESAGTGDVAFNPGPRQGGRRHRRLFEFQRVPDPRAAADRVRAWLEEREREALDGAGQLRSLRFPSHGFALRVPADWAEGAPTADPYGSFHVLSETSGLGVASNGADRLVALYGPLGASCLVDSAPAGRWTYEEAAASGGGILRFRDIVEAQRDLRIGNAPGFAVTYTVRLNQRLHPRAPSPAVVEATVRTVVLDHGDLQIRFSLGWMARFDAMGGALAKIVETLEPTPD